MKLAILLCALALCSVVYGAAPFATDRTNQKQVDAMCTLRDDGLLELYANIQFNGNGVDAVLALPGAKFQRDANGNGNNLLCNFDQNLATDDHAIIEADVFANGGMAGSNTCGAKPNKSGCNGNNLLCNIPKNLTTDDHAIIEADVFANGGMAGSNPCGAKPMRDDNTNELVGYEWYIQVRERFADMVYTDIDRTYHIQCLFDAIIRNYVTTSVRVSIADDLTGTARPVNPTSILSVVSDDSTVALGEEVRLRVQTQQSPSRGPLHPYGSYVYQCDVRYFPTGSRTIWLDSLGCPTTSNQFGLGEGFQYYRYDTVSLFQQTVRVFETQTPGFVLAPSRPPNDFFYITCFVQYCTGAENSDSKCSDFCSYNRNLNGKKKRSTHVPSVDADTVSIAIRIDYTDSDTGADDSESTTLIAILATVGAVFFLLVVIATCCVCFAFRRRADDDDDSTADGSTNNLPRHLKEEHFRPTKF